MKSAIAPTTWVIIVIIIIAVAGAVTFYILNLPRPVHSTSGEHGSSSTTLLVSINSTSTDSAFTGTYNASSSDFKSTTTK